MCSNAVKINEQASNQTTQPSCDRTGDRHFWPDLSDWASDRKTIDQAIGCPSRAKQHDRATAIGGSDRDRDQAERSDRSGMIGQCY